MLINMSITHYTNIINRLWLCYENKRNDAPISAGVNFDNILLDTVTLKDSWIFRVEVKHCFINL